MIFHEKLINSIDEAIKNNITTFDTAYAYRLGASEKIVGELIGKYDRNNLTVSTKFTPGLEEKESNNPVLKMLEDSRKRINTDYIDIYWIHNASTLKTGHHNLSKYSKQVK